MWPENGGRDGLNRPASLRHVLYSTVCLATLVLSIGYDVLDRLPDPGAKVLGEQSGERGRSKSQEDQGLLAYEASGTPKALDQRRPGQLPGIQGHGNRPPGIGEPEEGVISGVHQAPLLKGLQGPGDFYVLNRLDLVADVTPQESRRGLGTPAVSLEVENQPQDDLLQVSGLHRDNVTRRTVTPQRNP